ncbi:histamine H2 receptor isoform X2 [Ornithorhynchus anatinus]|uniref:histamine H2 receptor isoform X2 n=1 Tax=Ornithorhynchus anatinus TaxID=9258 RepID=UPI0010A7BEDD|nr:histamine H2 receptor isoform X2 [Ornithorhynchus anatinus]
MDVELLPSLALDSPPPCPKPGACPGVGGWAPPAPRPGSGRPGMTNLPGANPWNSTVSQVVGGITLGTLILVVIGGNVVVCLAVGLDRRLRSPTNCFTVSLAVTDLLLGILVLPLSAILELSQTWVFSQTLCKIHASLDVMLCTASILNLFMISLDRYYAITAPLRYPAVVTPARVGTALAGIWTVSLLFSFLPIHMGWNAQNAQMPPHPNQCKVEVNKAYGLVDALVTFYFPLLVMSATYYRIFKIAREQAKRINQAGSRGQGLGPCSPAVKEHKATVTLAAVMGVFIICWFPYFTVFVYRGVRGDEAINKTLEAVVLWLGYANSALNPLLYAALNRDFRAAYRRLFSCRGTRSSAHLESTSWREKRSLGPLVRNETETSLDPEPPDRLEATLRTISYPIWSSQSAANVHFQQLILFSGRNQKIECLGNH